MAGPILWILLGALGALLGAWLVVLARRWYHRQRYGLPIAHEELLVRYGRRMAALMDREALARLLVEAVSGSLDASRAMVLLAEGHDLVAVEGASQADERGPGLHLPVLHAAVRRVASGTETHYNYSSEVAGSILECHVTYELRGVYDESSALFLLGATRSNQSQSCDREFVESNFPAHRNYTVQVDAVAGGKAAVRHADNGDRLASADWQNRHMSFTTEETCELM